MTSSPHTAVLVGSAGGILTATAAALAADEYRVFLVDRDAARLDEQRAALGSAVVGSAVLDVTDEEAAARVFQDIADEVEPDVLVNGVGGDTRVLRYETLTVDHFHQTYRENVLGTFSAVRAIVPGMERRGYGRVVNFASAGGRTYSHFNNAAYVAAKAAVIGFTKQIGYELAGTGVVANAVAHGPIATARVAGAWERRDPAQKEQVLAGIPAGRLGTVAEAIGSVVYLASPGAGYTTGTVIDVNGGLLV